MDATVGNSGNGPRPENHVDTYEQDGISYIGSTETGEWMEYSVWVDDSADYALEIHASSLTGNSSFRIESDGVVLIDDISPVAVSAENEFEVLRNQVFMESGPHILRVYIEQPGIFLWKMDLNPLPVVAHAGQDTIIQEHRDVPVNIILDGSQTQHLDGNPLEITWEQTLGPDVSFNDINEINPELSGLMPGNRYRFKITASDGTYTDIDSVEVVVNMYQEAYPEGEPHLIPGEIPAWQYDYGGHTISYFDNDHENLGDGPRQNGGVDTELGDNGNPTVGWIRSGEWIEYTVNVEESGNYILTFRVASGISSGKFRLEINGENLTGTVTVLDTGGWNVFIDDPEYLNIPVVLEQGEQKMRLVAEGDDFNISSFSFQHAGTQVPFTDFNSPIRVYPNPADDHLFIDCSFTGGYKLIITDIHGRIVKTSFMQGIRVQSVDLTGFLPGVYMGTISANHRKQHFRFVIK
jgi:hypothetical protein